jgi:hypothetical protein
MLAGACWSLAATWLRVEVVRVFQVSPNHPAEAWGMKRVLMAKTNLIETWLKLNHAMMRYINAVVESSIAQKRFRDILRWWSRCKVRWIEGYI